MSLAMSLLMTIDDVGGRCVVELGAGKVNDIFFFPFFIFYFFSFLSFLFFYFSLFFLSFWLKN